VQVNDLPNGFTGYAHNSNFQYSRDHEKTSGVQAFSDIELQSLADRDRRWSWVEVDRSAIQYNVSTTRRMLGQRCRLMAVVKADAYGHGAVEVAKIATSAGASYLGVATINEGIELREAGLREPILLLAEPPVESVPLLLHHHIIPSVYTPDFAIAYAEVADAHNMKAPFHLAINTGMNRIGVRHDQVVEFLSQVSFHRALELEGCFTHFATSDAQETLDFQRQIKRFVESMRAVEAAGINPGIVHCDNSAGIYRFPKTHFDMVRLGISLYGYQPAADTHRLVQLRPAMSVFARITNVIQVPVGEGVSYGLNYRSKGSVKICTVPLGYADGLIRLLSGQIKFAYQDREVAQVGNICMDQCMFEVDIRSRAGYRTLDPQIGDVVQIAGPHPHVDTSIDTMAKKAATIQHEVTIGFSHRMPRYYV
jgi:alanine racemase